MSCLSFLVVESTSNDDRTTHTAVSWSSFSAKIEDSVPTESQCFVFPLPSPSAPLHQDAPNMAQGGKPLTPFLHAHANKQWIYHSTIVDQASPLPVPSHRRSSRAKSQDSEHLAFVLLGFRASPSCEGKAEQGQVKRPSKLPVGFLHFGCTRDAAACHVRVLPMKNLGRLWE